MRTYKKVLKLIFVILLLISITSCRSELFLNNIVQKSKEIVFNQKETLIENEKEQDMRKREIVLNRVNNNEIADKLITTTYPEDVLNKLDTRIDYIEDITPPECVRIVNDYLYIIFKSDTGHYLFLFYDFSNNNTYPLDRWYCNNITLKDLEKIAQEYANISEVMKMDPFCCNLSSASSMVSACTLHHTIDGYMVRIEYICEIGKPMVINKITTFDGEQNPLFYYLLPIDKELITNFYDNNSEVKLEE